MKWKGAKGHILVQRASAKKDWKGKKKHIKKAKATGTHSGKASISHSRERKKERKKISHLSFGHNGMVACQFQYSTNIWEVGWVSTIHCGVVVHSIYYLTEKNTNLPPLGLSQPLRMACLKSWIWYMVEGKTWRLYKWNMIIYLIGWLVCIRNY